MTDFGSFQKVFEENHHYLTLLNLDAADTPAAIGAVKVAATSNANVENELCAFLDDPNWRFHLPAAVSVAFVKPSERFINKLWETFDKGSWVAPQIAAVLSLYDVKFIDHAVQRLSQLCPLVNTPAYESPIHRHVQAGPADNHDRLCKAVSTLATLLRTSSDHEIVALLHRTEIQKMIAEDIDGGGHIAAKWIKKFRENIEPSSGGDSSTRADAGLEPPPEVTLSCNN